MKSENRNRISFSRILSNVSIAQCYNLLTVKFKELGFDPTSEMCLQIPSVFYMQDIQSVQQLLFNT